MLEGNSGKENKIDLRSLGQGMGRPEAPMSGKIFHKQKSNNCFQPSVIHGALHIATF